jgi:hypothetical protein
LLVFTNPLSNPNPTGTLRIATVPPVQAPLSPCLACPEPAIRAFDPVAGARNSLVTVLGCDFGTGPIDVFLDARNAAIPRIGPVAPEAGATAERLQFRVPPTAMSGTDYFIDLVRSGVPRFSSPGTFRVQ